MSFVPSFEVEYEYQQIPPHLRPAEYTEAQLYQIAEAYAQQAKNCAQAGLRDDQPPLCLSDESALQDVLSSRQQLHRPVERQPENRMHYPLLVLRKVREAVGPNTILEMLWSFEDPPGGYTIDDSGLPGTGPKSMWICPARPMTACPPIPPASS